MTVKPYVPTIKWDGEMAFLQVRAIDGVIALFDDQGRMIAGVVGIKIDQDTEDLARADVSLILGRDE